MEINILNEKFQLEAVVDSYNSLIWTERYWKAGDFELYLPYRSDLLDVFKMGRYLQVENSNTTMVVEGIKIQTNADSGTYVTISGNSLERILDRRIVWGLQIVSGNFQNGIQSLLEKSIISPEIQARKISNFKFLASTDPSITQLKIDMQFTGDNIYDVISSLCKERGLGFRVTLNELGEFIFELYAGINRSNDQLENPHVTFSPEFENLLSSTYGENTNWIKNVTLIGGEDRENNRRYTSVGTATGLSRREYFTDARDIRSEIEDGTILTEEEYNAQLQQRGLLKLSKLTEDPIFDASIASSVNYILNQDYFKGDIVQISNGSGIETVARITEITISDDETGYSCYPTFEILDQIGG